MLDEQPKSQAHPDNAHHAGEQAPTRAAKELNELQAQQHDMKSRSETKSEFRPDEKKPPGNKPSDDAKNGGPKETAEKKRDEDDDQPPPSLKERIAKNRIAVIISCALLIAGAVGGLMYYFHAQRFVSTDDAFIDGRTVSVSPQVTGTITNVRVTDNQLVKAGDLLAEIDPRDYLASVAQAKAQIEQAQSSVEIYTAQTFAQQATIAQSKTQVTQAQASLEFSREQDRRYQELRRTGSGTVQRAQQATSDLRTGEANLASAQAAQTNAERQVAVLEAQIKSARAQIAQATAQKEAAEANLSRTKLYASRDGRIAKLTAVVGQLATPAQGLMIVVPSDLWVTANLKETQLQGVKVGQPVEIAIDASGTKLKGRVDSIQSGSGTVFSLLPAQNATGNYVKVVQRVPVKITFDERPQMQLGPGMSVVPTIQIKQ